MHERAASPKGKLAAKIEDAPVGGIIRLRAAPGEDRKSILVDGRAVCTLPAETLERLRVRPGAHWTPDLAARILRAAEEDRARRAAARLLDVRPRSKGELLERLRRAGVSESLRLRIIEDLSRAGGVNDESFARLYSRSIGAKPIGPRLIEHKLRAKRIDPGLAKRAAAETLAGRDLLAEATALARKRAALMPAKLDAPARARRLLGLLARRGYNAALAARAVRAVVKGLDIDD